MARRSLSPIEPLLRAVASASALDAIAKPLGKAARDTVPKGPVKDAISGTWLGHALHPMLTDVVVGSFLSATALDLIGGRGHDEASRRLIGLGIAAYGPTALTGVNDWADSEPVDDEVRRAGLLHAGINSSALALYAASLAARRRGGSGALLGTLGAGALAAAAYLGGHLSFSKGVGPDQTVFDRGPEDWVPALDGSELADRRPTRVVVHDTPVLLVRDRDQVLAIHDRCSHRGCSLADGALEGDEVVCACHGSRFVLRDGSLRGGPATAPQPAFQTRERDGRIEIRLIDPA